MPVAAAGCHSDPCAQVIARSIACVEEHCESPAHQNDAVCRDIELLEERAGEHYECSSELAEAAHHALEASCDGFVQDSARYLHQLQSGSD